MIARPFPPTRSALIAFGVALALAVAACGAPVEEESFTARPKSGQCWEATQAQAADWMDWLGSAPVDCSEEHTLETVAVLPVEGDYPASMGEEFPEAFIAAASETCEEPWAESTRWAKKPNRISNFFFYPPLEQYDAGQRWVRCDVGIFATGTGWAPEAHQLQVVTQSLAQLRAEQRKKPNLLTLCLDSDSTQIGVYGERLRVADCDQPHLWTMVRASDLSESKREEYPGPEEIGRRAEEMCTKDKPAAVSGWFWLPPTEGEWERDQRSAFCFWAEVPVTSV